MGSVSHAVAAGLFWESCPLISANTQYHKEASDVCMAGFGVSGPVG